MQNNMGRQMKKPTLNGEELEYDAMKKCWYSIDKGTQIRLDYSEEYVSLKTGGYSDKYIEQTNPQEAVQSDKEKKKQVKEKKERVNPMNTIGKAYISIEKMLFGDYRVQVWNLNLDSMLDREYFCKGFNSALETAMALKMDKESQFKDFPIYFYNGEAAHPKKLYD